MSVFESPPCHSVRMDQDQTYNLGSPDLREDALDDDPIFWNKKKGTNYDDKLICLYMPWKLQLVFEEELVSTLFLMYIHVVQVLL